MARTDGICVNIFLSGWRIFSRKIQRHLIQFVSLPMICCWSFNRTEWQLFVGNLLLRSNPNFCLTSKLLKSISKKSMAWRTTKAETNRNIFREISFPFLASKFSVLRTNWCRHFSQMKGFGCTVIDDGHTHVKATLAFSYFHQQTWLASRIPRKVSLPLIILFTSQ